MRSTERPGREPRQRASALAALAVLAASTLPGPEAWAQGAPGERPAAAAPAVATHNTAQARLRALTPTERLAVRRTPVVLATQAVAPAVVAITSTQATRKSPYVETFWGRYYKEPTGPESMVSLGSGVILDPAGVVVTNEHVVARATVIMVRTADGQAFRAAVVGTAPTLDLAVLRIKSAKPLPSAPLGDATGLLQGETVLAIGNPFGFAQTVSRGILSSTRRLFRSTQGTYFHWIQTDAAVNPGNSGGPLVNLLGEVVGINTARHTGGPGIGWSIPADVVRLAVDELMRYGRVRAPFLGVEVGPVRGLGVRVASVVPGGPADRAGVRQGDVIESVHGIAVADQFVFGRIARSLIPGQRARFGLKRGSVTLVVEGGRLTPRAPWPARFARRIGVRLGDGATHAKEFSLPSDRGVVLVDVSPGSRAWRRNLRRGDVILAVNNRAVDTADAVEQITSGLLPGHKFVVTVMRGRKTYTFVMTY